MIKTTGCGQSEFEFMQKISNITHLIIASDNFERLPALKVELKELKKLDASHNNITELNESSSFFEHTPNIEDVDLSSNNLTNVDYHAIYRLQNLTSLNLSCNQIITIEMSITINNSIQYARFDKLHDFDISHNQLTSADQVIEMNGTNLVILNLSSNPIQKIELQAFSKFSALKELNLCDTNLTELNFNATEIDILDEFNNSIVLNDTLEYEVCTIHKNLSNIERVFIPNKLENKSKEQSKSEKKRLEDKTMQPPTKKIVPVDENKRDEITMRVVIGMILALVLFAILAFIVIKSDKKAKMRRQTNLSVVYRHDARGTVLSFVGLDDDKQLLMESNH